MKDYLDDEFLYKHIPMAEKSVIDAIPPEDELNHTFSGRFLRKMKVLINYERRGAFGRAAVRFGRVAAAVLLIVFLLNTVLIVSVDAYREQFFEMIQTVTEKYTAFTVKMDDDAPVTELVPIEPSYIPEGFVEIERSVDSSAIEIVYSNGNRDICYSQMKVDAGVTYIDTEGACTKWIQIGEQDVYAVTEGNMITVYWVCDGIEFLIASNASQEKIMAVVESIIKK